MNYNQAIDKIIELVKKKYTWVIIRDQDTITISSKDKRAECQIVVTSIGVRYVYEQLSVRNDRSHLLTRLALFEVVNEVMYSIENLKILDNGTMDDLMSVAYREDNY